MVLAVNPPVGWYAGKEKKMAKYLGNAFSLNMVSVDTFTLFRAKKIAPERVPTDAVSVIGHADTARVVGGILRREVPANRVTLHLQPGDELYVAQYTGPRLQEGATELPEGAKLEFFEITFVPAGCKGCPACDCNACGMMQWTHGA